MQSKYKIRLLKANLFAASVVLALWSFAAPPGATVALWLVVAWLFITALQLDFSHRRAQGQPWQVLAGGLLLFLIAAAPERHSILIWVWAAVFMLPQSRWAATFNASAALLSWLLVAPLLSTPESLLLLLILTTLGVLAFSQTRQLINMNGAIRQRLRLIPGLNLWAGEQLLRDLAREQTRSEREAIHAEVIVIQVKRHQLWPSAQKLCELTYAFENVYRLNNHTLAILFLSRTVKVGTQRRKQLYAALPDTALYQHIPLMDLELSTLSLETLCQLPSRPLAEAA
ncbi:hypothetical protein [Vreelandella olivaria]|uniref:hypothetical protein n=1 Tax=Vreelandella olivaria TaxID=390919 RepID=UPI00201F44B2|nr:hypothetical protein [Halomonas olivaria]